MPKVKYQDKKHAASLGLIEASNTVMQEHTRQRCVLSLPQLYYQLVCRHVIPSSRREYRRLAGILR